MYNSHILPTSTSIRLLDIIDRRQDVIRCSMRVIDLDHDAPEFAAISYTWGDPITVREEPMPDLTGLTVEEHADQLPFTYYTSSMGPEGESICSVDGAKLDYYASHAHIPREEPRWHKRTLREVEVDGNRVSVQENLFLCFEALLKLRETLFKASGSENPSYRAVCLPIWADALCINQADLAERAAQVQLMGRLYKAAHVVFAWVGQVDHLSDLAQSAMAMILDFDATRLHARDSSYPEQQEVTFPSVPGMTSVHWFALFALFQRLWFRRAWVVQEAVFAKDIIMVCGPSLLSMNLVLAVVAFLEDTGLDHELCELGRNFLTGRAVSDKTRHWEKLVSFSSRQPNMTKELQVEPRDGLSFVLGYHHTRSRLGLCNAGMPMLHLLEGEAAGQRNQRWGVHLPAIIHHKDHDMIREFDEDRGFPGFRFERRPLRLLSVISHFRDLEATDPRDKVFAFLNLAEDGLGLVPDYTADVRTVFVQATRVMMEKRYRSKLAVLSQVQDPSTTRIQGLPSWVPDFSARLGRIPFDDGGYDDRFRAGTREATVMDIEETALWFNADDTLAVRAIKVDQVAASTQLGEDAIVQALQLALRGPAEYPIEARAWRSEGSRRYIRTPRRVTRIEALWRTLVTDDVTEMDDDFSLESKDNLAEGFSNWVLTDLLEARDLVSEWDWLSMDNWLRKLMEKSFCTRLNLWSVMYDGRQLSDGAVVPDFDQVLGDLTAKNKMEIEADGHPTMHIPSARLVAESISAVPTEEDFKKNKEPLGGRYKTPSMQQLTPLKRRKLRNFEKRMRKAIEGRKLFTTTSGMLGLGPKSIGEEAGVDDEVWILLGARVPFILRHVEGSKYKVVGEAYVHGVMYGEWYDCFGDWDESGGVGVEDICLV